MLVKSRELWLPDDQPPRLVIPDMVRGWQPEGYNQEADLVTQTADGADLNRMWDEFQRTIQLHNAERDAVVSLLTYRVGNPVERVLQPSDEDFEEASEFGEPRGIRLGVPFSLGFDFKWYDLAIRYTWMFLAESNQAQVEALNNTALQADNRLMFDRVLRAIFNNTNRTATINDQAVTVYPFYNADGTVPPTWKRTTHTGTHQHYITSGAATIDSGDLDTLEDHLRHHGYTIGAGYQLVVLVNRQEANTIRAFRVANGDTYDFIPSGAYGGGVYLEGTDIVGRPAGQVAPNEIGTYGPFHVIEEDYVPAGYVISFATGGTNAINNPVGLREHENAGLRGLRLVKGRDNDYPLVDSFYQHGLGTGIRHRGAGVVMQITANATYAIPTDYA